jgi:hypothetical protein
VLPGRIRFHHLGNRRVRTVMRPNSTFERDAPQAARPSP